MMMMMIMMLMPVFEVVVVVVFVSARSHVTGLELLTELVRKLINHLYRMLLLLRGSLFQSMMKSVHAVRLGEIGMLLVMIIVMLMVMMLLLQRMMRCDA